MEVVQLIKKRLKPAFSMMLVICCFLNTYATVGKEYRLDVLAELPTLSFANNIAIIPLPIVSNIKSNGNNSVENSNAHPYLLANETGELSLLKGTTLLSLSRLPLSNQTTVKQVKLTALTLHPSFDLADKAGYQTFFTAHIEPRKTNNNIARVTTLKNPTALPFDAVITQWQFNSSADNKVDEQLRREVIRIAVPTATHHIQKIAFNPYSKTWHDDYGLLYIALSETKSISLKPSKDALYSGVVLRINPAKFGLRNYMVPSSNPFMKISNINNEIFILGAQYISSFSWSKQHYDAVLVQHTYAGAHQVVVAKKGADWQNSYQEKQVFPLHATQADSSNIFPYYGRKLKTLIGSILYLTNNTKNWQLAKLTNKNSEIKEELTGQAIWSFNNKELPAKNKVALVFDHAGEPLLLDFTDKQLLSVTPKQIVTENNNSVQVEDKSAELPIPANSSAYGNLLITLCILILAVVFYRLRPTNNIAKTKLRSQFARFELDESQTQLLFYKRHQSKVDSKIAIADIVKSEVLLNGSNISIINKDNGLGYSAQKENQLRLSFTQVHRHKLIDNELREVDLYLTDEHNKTHVVCLYLRKGNQRLTKAKYFETLESLIDWNWFIAQQLNPQGTEQRKIETVVTEKPVSSPQKVQKPQKANNVPPIKTETQQTAEILHDIAIHDSELINALDKLADLKQKGFLTEEEFSLAKSKILSDITDNK